MEASILETQYEFITSEAKKTLFLGGVGCISPETKLEVKIDGVEQLIEVSSPLLQKQKHNLYKSFNGIGIDYRKGTRPFKKGVGPMYRVISEEGEVIAYREHQFLCSDLHYRATRSFDSDGLFHLISMKKENMPYFLFEDIYLLFDKTLKFIKWFLVRSMPFRSISYLFAGKLFDPTMQNVIDLFSSIVSVINDKIDIFSVRITQYHCVSQPLEQKQLIHFYNEFCFELTRLSYDLLPRYMAGDKNKKHILKTVDHLQKILFSHDLRYHPSDIYKNKILTIEQIGDGEYWDLQVPDTHNYITEGFVHHNSGKTYSGGDFALNMVSKYPRTEGLLTAGTNQQLVNSTVKALTDRWDEIGLVRGVDYKTTLGGVKKRIDLLGSTILLYSLHLDVPAKGITVGWWLGDESSYVKKKLSILVGQD